MKQMWSKEELEKGKRYTHEFIFNLNDTLADLGQFSAYITVQITNDIASPLNKSTIVNLLNDGNLPKVNLSSIELPDYEETMETVSFFASFYTDNASNLYVSASAISYEDNIVRGVTLPITTIAQSENFEQYSIIDNVTNERKYIFLT